ncbi:hypothetical protein PENFLA_c001G05780 [Penicillium flavigenum]|uniref:Uncharacterized protein n=1 Tax=Penicillium flavigenum TaxID=254877 RepID=A0A1V6U2H4_9EURO|nr:hypothetical protein PENFLA_c001G05780 [Penicillium flavigenum]
MLGRSAVVGVHIGFMDDLLGLGASVIAPADVTRTDASGDAACQVVASFRVMAYRVVSTVRTAFWGSLGLTNIIAREALVFDGSCVPNLGLEAM